MSSYSGDENNNVIEFPRKDQDADYLDEILVDTLLRAKGIGPNEFVEAIEETLDEVSDGIDHSAMLQDIFDQTQLSEDGGNGLGWNVLKKAAVLVLTVLTPATIPTLTPQLAVNNQPGESVPADTRTLVAVQSEIDSIEDKFEVSLGENETLASNSTIDNSTAGSENPETVPSSAETVVAVTSAEPFETLDMATAITITGPYLFESFGFQTNSAGNSAYNPQLRNFFDLEPDTDNWSVSFWGKVDNPVGQKTTFLAVYHGFQLETHIDYLKEIEINASNAGDWLASADYQQVDIGTLNSELALVEDHNSIDSTIEFEHNAIVDTAITNPTEFNASDLWVASFVYDKDELEVVDSTSDRAADYYWQTSNYTLADQRVFRMEHMPRFVDVAPSYHEQLLFDPTLEVYAGIDSESNTSDDLEPFLLTHIALSDDFDVVSESRYRLEDFPHDGYNMFYHSVRHIKLEQDFGGEIPGRDLAPIEFTWSMTENLELNASYGYIDSEFLSPENYPMKLNWEMSDFAGGVAVTSFGENLWRNSNQLSWYGNQVLMDHFRLTTDDFQEDLQGTRAGELADWEIGLTYDVNIDNVSYAVKMFGKNLGEDKLFASPIRNYSLAYNLNSSDSDQDTKPSNPRQHILYSHEEVKIPGVELRIQF